MKKNWLAASSAILFMIVLSYFVYIITRATTPAGECNAFECYVDLSIRKINETSEDINFWANSLTSLFILTVIFSSITAVMFGLQDDKTKHWSRPIGLISTTLGAAIGTLVSTFNPQGNIDKLITIRSETASLANKLKIDVRRVRAIPVNEGKPDIQIPEIQALFDDFAEKMNRLSDRKARLKIAVGRFNILEQTQEEKPAKAP